LLPERDADELRGFLVKNQKVMAVLERAPQLKMKNWYLGAGCIAQTVWNIRHGFSPEGNIKDYDLVYYDASDLSYETEGSFIRLGTELFKDLGVGVEVRNEARVHLWYKDHFGRPLEFLDGAGKKHSAYRSVEDAISTWPTTATSIGVKLDWMGGFTAYAPFGLDDLFGMVVRPNKRGVSREVYLEKARRWASLWPKLRVIPWEDVP